MDAVDDAPALEEVVAFNDNHPDSSIYAIANATERELQQTSVQAFINSYQR